MKYKMTFTAWYMNVDRLSQLLRQPNLTKRFPTFGKREDVVSAGSAEDRAMRHLNTLVEDWLSTNKAPSLAELMITGKGVRPGDLFTIYQDFYGKGLSKYSRSTKPLPRDAVAQIYGKLKYAPQTVRIEYSPWNLTSSTAWHRLAGHTRLFAFCYAERVDKEEILARPYIIGDAHTGWEFATPSGWRASEYGEISLPSIDQFKAVQEIYDVGGKAPSLELLRDIPEKNIKAAIVEIIGEEIVPKDWGGEQSDLFTTNLTVEGNPVTAAFLLKGPARFSRMQMTHLGKNGDQIVRLFDEPADLLILQHCHEVSTAVRKTMRAFASTTNNLRHFVVIDGYHTIALLQAYEKWGFKRPRKLRRERQSK